MKFALILLFVAGPIASFAQTDVLRQKHYNVKDGLALEGYDAVSYFDGKPAEGKSNLTYSYKGLTYRFSTQANLAKFKSSPDTYEPAYGGWCAYAMGENGEKVKVDPETYKILEGKLYLFYNFWANNTLEKWNKNQQKLKDSADRNWSKIVH